MYTPKKSSAPLVLGILSIVFGLLFAIVGLVLGIIGLAISNSNSKNTPHTFKTEMILSTIGIVIAIGNMLFTYFVLLPQFMP